MRSEKRRENGKDTDLNEREDGGSPSSFSDDTLDLRINRQTPTLTCALAPRVDPFDLAEIGEHGLV